METMNAEETNDLQTSLYFKIPIVNQPANWKLRVIKTDDLKGFKRAHVDVLVFENYKVALFYGENEHQLVYRSNITSRNFIWLHYEWLWYIYQHCRLEKTCNWIEWMFNSILYSCLGEAFTDFNKFSSMLLSANLQTLCPVTPLEFPWNFHW